MTNLGKWDIWYRCLYRNNAKPEAYGRTPTWKMGSEWLADCELVEDWGCGKGWLKTLLKPSQYRGLDGSHTPFADEIVDLAEYRSSVPGIFMRHVLEHNYNWTDILDNALASFTERMVLILFTPFVSETQDLEFEDPPGVPNLAFRLGDLTDRMVGLTYTYESIRSPETRFGVESIFRIER